MLRAVYALVATLVLLAGCATAPTDPNQRNVFRIKPNMVADIQFRHVDSINAVRQAQGLQPLELSSQLTAAAKTHAQDIARQNRPWHFGSDGSNPLERVARTGYAGGLIAENISESFESDVETLEAWLRDPTTRAGILRPDARNLGISWYQEPSGKLWWVQVLGS